VNADKKGMRSCDKDKGEICTKEGEDMSAIKEGGKRGARVC